MGFTERHDLVSGTPVWEGHEAAPPSDPLPTGQVDIAIIGAGIMGAMLADALSDAQSDTGHSIALVDRRPPASGSTAASTALVMWEMDVPLTHLAEQVGTADAARRWRRVYEAVQRLHPKVQALGQDATLSPVVYLAGTLLDTEALKTEAAARAAADLPSRWHDAATVAERFGIAPRDAIVSERGYVIDPVALSLALLDRARARGVTVSWPTDVTRIEQRPGAIALVHDEGELLASRVIIASGYERARAFLPPAFSLLSSYAMATRADTAPLWNEAAMIWEASDPYLYVRTDPAGRIIAGGEDVDFHAPETARDALIETKAGTIAGRLATMIDAADIPVDRRWTATFGSSPDGLPAIGPVDGYDNLWLAAGFGGNGVSFAALAAELIAADFAGAPDPMVGAFDPYRFA